MLNAKVIIAWIIGFIFAICYFASNRTGYGLVFLLLMVFAFMVGYNEWKKTG